MGKSKAKSKGGGSSNGNNTLSIDPLGIYFTHSKIRPVFTGCGKRIEDTLTEIREGVTKVTDLPLITIIPDTAGNYYSLNNRRLYVLKQLKREGIVDNATVRVKQPLEREKVRYTPERCSSHCSIMKEREKEEKEIVMESKEEEEEEEKENSAVGLTQDLEGVPGREKEGDDDSQEEEGEEEEEEEEERGEVKKASAFSVFSLDSEEDSDGSDNEAEEGEEAERTPRV